MLSTITFQCRYGNQCFDMLFSQDQWLATIRPHPTATIPSSPPSTPTLRFCVLSGEHFPARFVKIIYQQVAR